VTAEVFLMENIAADISSIGKDNLGKAGVNLRIYAQSIGISNFLPVWASDAGFGAVDFHQ
jgi:hypothetical protein